MFATVDEARSCLFSQREGNSRLETFIFGKWNIFVRKGTGILYGTNKVANARKTMRVAFKNDPELERTYVDNIAILLHDRHGITNIDKRNKAAKDILKLIFS